MITPKPKSVLELFEGHPERWCKSAAAVDRFGDRVEATDPTALRRCLYGACCYIDMKNGKPSEKSRFTILAEVQPDPIGFNDSANTTFEMVVELVRKAGV